jgi:hypothetical protein
MSVNILAAANTSNNRATAASIRRPVNNFPPWDSDKREFIVIRYALVTVLRNYAEEKRFSMPSGPRLYNESRE